MLQFFRQDIEIKEKQNKGNSWLCLDYVEIRFDFNTVVLYQTVYTYLFLFL
jgi:hypothetical protein